MLGGVVTRLPKLSLCVTYRQHTGSEGGCLDDSSTQTSRYFRQRMGKA